MRWIQDRGEWNRTIKGFPDWDVYYLYEYARSLELHGDGTPILLYWQGGETEICYAAMLEDIADCKGFYGTLPRGKYYDLTTPYGYGGPLVKGELSGEMVQEFVQSLTAECKRRNIVSQFFRFDPFVEAQKQFFEVFGAKTFKNTVYMDLESEEAIVKNMDPKNRNMVRKAKKNEVEIFCDYGEHLEEFLFIYGETMKRNQAEDYYYFKRDYFEYLQREWKDHVIYFYAVYGQKIISASMFLYNDQFMHYHLSGTLWEYRQLASVNLLLYEAALWGRKHGIKKLHLGGGMEANDGLYGFKKQFNRKGALPFMIGRCIFQEDIFEFLVEERAKADKDFDVNRPFLIKYRG